MSADVNFIIKTNRDGKESSGMDTSILVVPSVFFVKVDAGAGEEPALAVQPLSKFLGRLAEQQAKDINEVLHHSEWVITSDPETVQRLGSVHDCEQCREGVVRALGVLEKDPTSNLAVGHLYWVKQ